MESLGGGKRFLAVYAVSALTSTHSAPLLFTGAMLLSLHVFHFLLRLCMKLLFSPLLTEQMLEVAGSGLSYTLCTAPSVGASGAIFGLVSIML